MMDARLAPTGVLRAALYRGGPTNVVVDARTGDMRGVGFDLGKELARRLGVTYQPVIYATPKRLIEDVDSGNWDVAFVARDAHRETLMSFTAVYMSIGHGFLVSDRSDVLSLRDAGRPGIRVGVPAGGAVIPPLRHLLPSAVLVEIGMPDAAELVRSGRVDVFAANKANLFEIADRAPGWHVLEECFSFDRFALGLPKRRAGGLPVACRFIDSAVVEGLVTEAVKRAGARGVVVPRPDAGH